MRKPFVFDNGQLNWIKLLLLSIVFSVLLTFFIMVIELSTRWVYDYFPTFLLMVSLLGSIQLYILVVNDVRLMISIIKSFIVKLIMYKPLASRFENLNIDIKSENYINTKTVSYLALCVFRC